MNEQERAMNARRAACFRVSAELLKQALGIPETATVYGAQWDFGADGLRVFVIGETLPIAPYECPLFEATPAITEKRAANGRLITRTWKWDV